MRRALALSLALVVSACASNDRRQPDSAAAEPTTTVTTVPAASPTTPPPVLTSAPAPVGLTAALESAWASAPGGCIAVARGRDLVFERGGDVTVPPASTVKLVTAAAAVEVLGADARLRTLVVSTAAPEAGVVRGDVWLVGGGDPVLGTDAWAATVLGVDDPRTSLDALADSVVAAGVRRIEGAVVGDDSRYDVQRYVSTWPPRLVRDGEAGPLSALSVNDGFRVWGHPGVPFDDPPREGAAIFGELLRARGVQIAGEPRNGAAPVGAIALTGTASPPVGELVGAMLRDSDNGTAELLLKEIGRQEGRTGSTAGGLAAVGDVLASRGVGVGASVVGDASGLSDVGRVTCRFLVSVLAAFGPELDGRLAVAGVSGTLRRRLLGTPAEGRVRAKTGSLDGMSALAGYADGGSTYSFAVVVTGLPPETSARTLHDRLALELVALP